jgi:hypothetical protein
MYMAMHTVQKIRYMCSQKKNSVALFPIPTSDICERFIYSQDRSAYLAAEK